MVWRPAPIAPIAPTPEAESIDSSAAADGANVREHTERFAEAYAKVRTEHAATFEKLAQASPEQRAMVEGLDGFVEDRRELLAKLAK